MTPRRSVRAATRDIYSTMPGRELALGLAPEMGQGPVRKVDVAIPPDQLPQDTPLPNPPPQGGRGQSEFGEGQRPQQPSLMARVRHLYEDTAVPVREIARLAGVTERTLYKYVIKGKWRRRYILKPRGKAAASGNRGLRWQRAAGHEGVKGAGGRFIARAEANRKVVRGLKALDPRKRAQANEACAAASAHHDAAQARVQRWQIMDARCRALERLNRRLGAYQRYRDKQAKFMEASYPDVAATIEAFHSQELTDSLHELERLRGGAAAAGSRPA